MTPDQRWLLFRMGGWQIVSALCSPDGTADLMRSCWGSTGHSGDLPNGAPKWLDGCGWDTNASTITAHWLRGKPAEAPELTIKAAQINRYAAQLPDSIKQELLECRAASTGNAVLRQRFCRCGSKPCGYPYIKDKICPPTVEQENQAEADYWRIRAWEYRVLAKALELNDASSGDQLELFGAAL